MLQTNASNVNTWSPYVVMYIHISTFTHTHSYTLPNYEKKSNCNNNIKQALKMLITTSNVKLEICSKLTPQLACAPASTSTLDNVELELEMNVSECRVSA